MFKKYHLDLTKLNSAIDNKQLPSIVDIKVETPVMDSKLSLYSYLIEASRVRDRYIEACGFSIITKELIDEMATLLKDCHILEIGCGNGYLALSFKQRYPDVTYETLDNDKWEWVHRHITLDHTANYGEFDFSKYGAVIVSWPDLDCEDIGEALASLPTGCLLLLCGESRGGCTGTHEMFDVLATQFYHIETLTNSLGFLNINDTWELYRKH